MKRENDHRDIDFMKMAYGLALRAKGRTSPNPLVGAVIVKQNRVISIGYHQRCGGDHAEIIALKKAGPRAKGAKLYVTLEPCAHFGRTPPCADRIIQSGIKEVIVGMKDPNPVTCGRSLRRLRQSGIKVKVGFLKQELSKMNEAFIKYIKYKMPFVVAKCAQTLDGKVATRTGQSRWITSSKTREISRRLRKDFDAIVVGVNTVRKDNPFLNATGPSKPIKKIIIDSTLDTPVRARLFQNTRPQDITLCATKEARKNKLKTFTKKGINVMICPGAKGRVSLRYVFRALAQREITNILIEGGSQIIGSALKKKLVDKMWVLIAPKILGDQKAISSVRGLSPLRIDQAILLKDLACLKIDQDLWVEAYVCRNR
ncbi:MAG: bifunctional diaminohydroxyphosphoribosylaminopyrimidine deaminase/5-amino-6-(5-phosphoribosylamino)uracil reductase RibD [Candidatus Omnitrophota bacterium]